MEKLIKTLVLSNFLAYCTLANAAIVGPVNVIAQVNDGTQPAQCTASLNDAIGGIIEMALDLDQDGTTDVCFGSNSTDCNAGFNFDASTHNGTILSTQGDGSGSQIMGGADTTLAFWDGQAIGPNFQAASGSTLSAGIGQTDQPLVFGFRGGSSTATTEYGMFSFTVNSADCSIDFGQVDYATGANTYSNIVAALVAAVVATPVPTLSTWGLLILSALVGFIGISKRNRKQI